jgi:glyoxylase-like metal-dependent hydrolase (beta-lactamase superfamily II)
MTTHYSIDVIKVAQADVRGPEVYWMSAWDDWETLYFYMLVIRGGGKTVVVNTGPPAPELLGPLNEKWVHYIGDARAALKVEESERPEAALSRLGVSPDAVDAVILTPFQIYSTANLRLFSRATICLSRRGWSAFHSPRFATTHAARRDCFPDEVLAHLVTDAWDRVRLIEDDDIVLPGLRTFWVGGHHRESTAICVQTRMGDVIYSDCIFKYPNIEAGRMLGIAESIEECRVAYDRIARESQIVIAGYDPQVLSRFPGGRIE